MQRKMINLIFLSIVLLTTFNAIAADNFERWESPRDYQHVIMSGEFVSNFLGLPIDEIFAYSYNEAENEWKQVPIQIDERDDSSHVFLTNPNRVLDNRDQILFMARDMGDRVEGDYVWIDDESSKSFSRYELTVGDPTEPGEQAHLYLYHSTTIMDTTQGYMQYTVADAGKGNDIIVAAGYEERHTDLGIPNYLSISSENGGNGEDLLDRWKVRLKAFAFILELDETEEFLKDPTIEYVAGKIRISRRISFIAYLFGQPTLPFTIPMYYYPYTSEADIKFNLNTQGVDVSHFRQSIDLSSNADGMIFHNNFNSDIVIDGAPDVLDTSLVFETEVVQNWNLITGEQGSMLTLFSLTPEANTRLYYHDDSTGGTGDSRPETGDMQSWGDIGVLKTGESLKNLGVPYTTFYLPRNQDPAFATDLEEKSRTPFVLVRVSQNYQEPLKVIVTAPDTTGPLSSMINLPITIGDVTGLSLRSAEIDLRYDTSVLQFAGITTDNTIAMAWDNYNVQVKNDGIDVKISGASSITGSGDLVFIEFSVIGDVGDTTILRLDDVMFDKLSVAADKVDGFFEVTPPEVRLTLPDITAASGDNVTVPVKASDFTGLGVVSANIMISFDPTVLDAISISTENTLSSGWTNIAFNDFSNRAHIIMSGGTELSGEGTFFNINFAVNGPDGSQTTLVFMSATLNSGSPLAIKENGSLSVEGIIPVELAMFEANLNRGKVALNWTTLSESNNYGFQIERKNNIEQQWTNIGFVKGHGTTNTQHDYVFIDKSTEIGTYTYRLKQIDYDGGFAYSHESTVEIDAPRHFTLAQNYPNPFNPTTTIDYELSSINGNNVKVELAIYNLLGKKIKTLVSENQSAGFYSVTWDGTDEFGDNVTTGIYVYRLQANEYVATKRMVFLK